MNDIFSWWSVREALFGRDLLLGDNFDEKNTEEKVKSVLEYLSKYEKPLNIHQEFKSLELSVDYIERAHANSRSMSWQSLIEMYTQDVIHAQPDSKELAQAYVNRSAVLYKCGLNNEAQIDIERALKIDYPGNLENELNAQGDKYHMAMNKTLNIEPNESNKDKTCETNIFKKLPISCLSNKLFKKIQYQKFLPQPPQDNPKIIHSSGAIDLKYSEKYGRYVIATRNITAGEVLLVHKSYASIVEPHLMHKYCWQCSKRIWAGVPCHQCISVIYCDETCRDNAWDQHHDIECPVIVAMLSAKMEIVDIMSLRLTVKAYKEAGTLEKLKEKLDEINTIQDPIAKCFNGSVFDHTKHASVYSLWKANKDSASYALKASIVLYFLAATTTIFDKKINNFEELVNNQWTVFIGGLIMRHIEISIMNCVTMCIDDETGNSIDRGGILNPFISLFNHSCDPMVIHYANGEMNSLISIHNIKKGEQIFYDYGASFWDESTSERRESLLEKFDFLCQCKACMENWGPHSRLFFPSHVMKSWPPVIEKTLNLIRIKYPSIMSMVQADDADKPLIISTAFDMINIYQRNIKYYTRELFELKALLHLLYYSVRC